MAGKKKQFRCRILVTVTPEVFELLSLLSVEAGASMAGLCGQFLQDAIPALESVLKGLREARAKNADVFDTLARALSEAHIKTAKAQIDLLDTKDSIRRGRSSNKNENGQNK